MLPCSLTGAAYRKPCGRESGRRAEPAGREGRGEGGKEAGRAGGGPGPAGSAARSGGRQPGLFNGGAGRSPHPAPGATPAPTAAARRPRRAPHALHAPPGPGTERCRPPSPRPARRGGCASAPFAGDGAEGRTRLAPRVPPSVCRPHRVASPRSPGPARSGRAARDPPPALRPVLSHPVPSRPAAERGSGAGSSRVAPTKAALPPSPRIWCRTCCPGAAAGCSAL